jgi:biopolymer transport protein ExbD
MRIEKKQRAGAVEPDLTPMIDVTFLLISFFVMVINFSQSEQNDKVILPTSELARPPEEVISDPIIIHMTSQGTVVIGGDEIAVEVVRTRLNPELAVLQLAGKTAADANIIIRGHRETPGGRVQDLINRCQEIGFEKFLLRVKEELRN